MKETSIIFKVLLTLAISIFFADCVLGQDCGDGTCSEEETIETCPKDCFTPGSSIRELLNWDAMHDWTLEQLGWKVTSREILPSGVTVIRGVWDAGPFTSFNNKENVQTINLAEAASIYLPPNVSNMISIPGIVDAVHVEKYLTGRYYIPEALAKHLNVAVIRHGGREQNCQQLGFANRDALLKNMIRYAQILNPGALFDPITANFGLFLAKVNVLALTLLDRVLEQEGCDLNDAAIKGESKEGYAAWIVSAVDSRVKITMLGHFQLHDFISGFSAYEENSGCGEEEPGAQYRSCITTGPGGLTIRQLTRFKNWLLDSSGGQSYNDIFSPSSFVDLLYPENILFFGDVGTCGMHDGCYYTPGAETEFLEGFSERAWRYDRSNMNHPCDERQLIANLAWSLTHNSSIAHIPKVRSASALVSGPVFSISANVSPMPVAVRLWLSYSEDREFDDPDNPPWVSLPLFFNDGNWRSEWIACPDGSQVGWYVEAEDTIVIRDTAISVKDSSPIRFLYELPPLTCDTPICYCELFPDKTVVSGGETLGFQATVTNITGLTGTAYFGTKVTGSTNGMYPPSGFLDGPFSVLLDPYHSKSVHLFRTVPSNLSPGTYIYRGYVGQNPWDIYDQCEFEFQVME